MGEKGQQALKLQFDKRLRLEFHGSTITSNAGLLACRELDEALVLTENAPTYLQETCGGRNVQHELVPLLRQSVYLTFLKMRHYNATKLEQSIHGGIVQRTASLCCSDILLESLFFLYATEHFSNRVMLKVRAF